ncbi:MAG: hypothetical protein JRJ29_10130 [Deltaproteobacteria bacterium]|nr:hypothetical protein [Deltaproteobacteria bacterium]
MPSSGRQKSDLNLSALLEGLLRSGVDFILVGGLAAVVQGAPVVTMDVDIVPDPSSENVDKLLGFLRSVGAFHRRLDEKIIEPRKRDISGKGHALFSTRLGPIDVLGSIEERKTYSDLLEHSIDIEFKGHTMKVLDLKVMIELKKKSSDPRDKQRLPVLEETLRQLQEAIGPGSRVDRTRDRGKNDE